MEWIPLVGMRTSVCSNYHCDGTSSTYFNSFDDFLYERPLAECYRSELNMWQLSPVLLFMYAASQLHENVILLPCSTVQYYES